MTKKRKKGSIFTLLLKNYILFTLLLLIISVGLMFFYLIKTITSVASIYYPEIDQSKHFLETEQYEAFAKEELREDLDFFIILDEEEQVIYQSESTVEIPTFTEKDLQVIPDAKYLTEIETEVLKIKDGVEHTSITHQNFEEEENIRYILNEENELIYVTNDLEFDQLNAFQVDLLKDKYFKDYNLRKYAFSGEEDAEYFLLYFSEQSKFGQIFENSWRNFYIILGLSYAGLVILFIVFLNRRIQKPLKLLNQEMNDFVTGEISQTDYQGPKEFVNIFENFHSMSIRLQESEKERKELEKEKRKILADISHDLKTPITVIQGYARALNDQLVPEEEKDEYLLTIEEKAKILDGLIDSFYEYSKIEHPEYSLNLQRVDVFHFIREYLADRYAEIERAGYHLIIELDEKQIFCMINEVNLRRVLDNIIYNTIQYNPKETKIYVSLQEGKDNIHLILADDGVGIPKAIQESIFQPFIVGESSRNQNHSGLGLSISKRIIEAHHGNLKIINPPSGYTTAFEIQLPILNETKD